MRGCRRLAHTAHDTDITRVFRQQHNLLRSREGSPTARWVSALVTAALTLGLTACSTPRRDVGTNLKERLEAMGLQSREFIQQAFDRQRIPDPEPEDPARILRPGEPIWIESGKSRVLHLAEPILRVSIGDPKLAGIVVLGPRTIMVNAKSVPGGTSQLRGGTLRSGAAAEGAGTGTALGRTLTPEPRLRETTLAIWTADGGYDVHALTVADFLNKQVLLEVTVAELNRTAMEQYGIDFRVVQNDFIAAGYLGGGAGPIAGGTIPGFPPVPLALQEGRPTFAFIFPNENVSALILALQTEGLATILAQPKLLALSGQNAAFQVGGEIPIRIVSGFAADVEFKPFGTLVNFLPRVSEDGDILLTVTPEVSTPDFSNTVDGIPTFLTRRTSTSMRLRSGQTLVIGGLTQATQTEQVEKVPYLGDLPGVGMFFRKSTYTNRLTELMIVVRPSLVQPLESGEEVPLPTDRGPFTLEEIRTKPNEAETTRPRVPGLP